MTDHTSNKLASGSRRNWLKYTSVLIVAPAALGALGGCSDDKAASSAPAPAPAADPKPAPAPAPQTTADSAPAPEPAADITLVELSEDDPTAKGLGYRASASDVDAGQYPKYADGQSCSNCALFQPAMSDDDANGGCGIFPGKLVMANGWCNAYVAKA